MAQVVQYGYSPLYISLFSRVELGSTVAVGSAYRTVIIHPLARLVSTLLPLSTEICESMYDLASPKLLSWPMNRLSIISPNTNMRQAHTRPFHPCDRTHRIASGCRQFWREIGRPHAD
jgi:hypothetical protein